MAKYRKGQSGNPNGRPRGSINAQTKYIREWVISVIGSKAKNLLQNFDRLPPKEQWRVISSLLPYVLPRQSEANVRAKVDFDKLSDDEINVVIENICETILNDED